VCTHDQEFIKKYDHKIKYRQSRYQLVVSSEEMSNDTFTTNQCDEDDEYLNMPKPRKLISRPVEVGDEEADDEGKEAPKQRQKLARQLTEDESRKKIEELKSNHVPAKQTKLMERPDTIRFNNKKRPVVASGVGAVGANFRKKIAKEMSKQAVSEVQKCVQCRKIIEERVVPKEVAKEFAKSEANLVSNWTKSQYCDHMCVRAYVTREIEKIRNDLPDLVVLVDASSASGIRQKKEFNTLDLSLLSREVYSHIVRNPSFTFFRATKASTQPKPVSRPAESTVVNQREKIKTVPVRSVSVQEKSVVFRPKTALLNDLTSRFEGLSAEQRAAKNIQEGDISEIVKSIEAEIDRLPVEKRNPTLIRIRKNLTNKSNESFFVDILSGKIRPGELMTMSGKDMADERVKAEDAKALRGELEGWQEASDERNYSLAMGLRKKTSKGEECIVNRSALDLDSLVVDVEVGKSSGGSAASGRSPKAGAVTCNKKSAVQKMPEPILPSIYARAEKSSTGDVEFPRSLTGTAVDTTGEHESGEHLMDMNCRICTGKSTATSQAKAAVKAGDLSGPGMGQEETLVVDIQLADGQGAVVLPVQSENSGVTQNVQTEKQSKKQPLPQTQIPAKKASPVQPILPQPSPVQRPTQENPLKSATNLSCAQQSPPQLQTSPKEPSPVQPLQQIVHSTSLANYYDRPVKCSIAFNDPVYSHIFSVNISLIRTVGPPTANHEFLLNNMQPFSLKLNKKHMIKFKESTFYHYIDHLIQKHASQPVFVHIKSAGGQDAKQTRESIVFHLPDDASFSIYELEHFTNKDTVISYTVPDNLQERFSHFYLIQINSKTLKEEYCPMLKSKYSILLPRTKKQIVGVFIDSMSEKSFRKNEIPVWRFGVSPTTSSPQINQSPNAFAKPNASTNKRRPSTERHPEEPEAKKPPTDPRLKNKAVSSTPAENNILRNVVEHLLPQVLPYLLKSEVELTDFLKRYYEENNVPVELHPNCYEHVVDLKNFTEKKAQEEKLQKERMEKEKQEKERLEKERLERERLEKERLEKERLEKERLEKERLEKERLEKERLEKERLEKERLEKERLEKERLEKERLERIQKKKIEKERLEQIRLEKEQELLIQKPMIDPSDVVHNPSPSSSKSLLTTGADVESSFFYINKILKDNLDNICELDIEDEIGHKKCKHFLEQIISVNMGTPQELTELQKAKLRDIWNDSYPDFMYLLDYKKPAQETLEPDVERMDRNENQLNECQGESLEAFESLLKLSQERNFKKDFSLDNVQWELNGNSFLQRYEDRQLSPTRHVRPKYKPRGYQGYGMGGGGYRGGRGYAYGSNAYNGFNKYHYGFRDNNNFSKYAPDKHTYIPSRSTNKE